MLTIQEPNGNQASGIAYSKLLGGPLLHIVKLPQQWKLFLPQLLAILNVWRDEQSQKNEEEQPIVACSP